MQNIPNNLYWMSFSVNGVLVLRYILILLLYATPLCKCNNAIQFSQGCEQR